MPADELGKGSSRGKLGQRLPAHYANPMRQFPPAPALGGQVLTLDSWAAILSWLTRRRGIVEGGVQEQPCDDGNGLRHRLAEVEQTQDDVAAVCHQHRRTVGQPPAQLENDLRRPIGELFGSLALRQVVAGGQGCEEWQSPDSWAQGIWVNHIRLTLGLPTADRWP